MILELMKCHSLLWIFVKQFFDDIFCWPADVFRYMNRLILIGQLTNKKLINKQSNTPHINSFAI